MSQHTQRIALVTGAGSGLGRAISRVLACDDVTVVAADRNLKGATETVDQIITAGGKAVPLFLDVSDRPSLQPAIDRLASEMGRIDVLVNNAGIAGAAKPALEVPWESWDRVLAVNLSSVLFMSVAVLPHMLAHGGGVIVNMASAAGTLASAAGVEYTAAKHGVLGLTKQLAYEYGRQGVRVVAVAPGVIQGTQLTAGVGISDGRYRELTMNAPAGRYGCPEEVGQVVAFLVSERASFIHGVGIPVDGGSTIY